MRGEHRISNICIGDVLHYTFATQSRRAIPSTAVNAESDYCGSDVAGFVGDGAIAAYCCRPTTARPSEKSVAEMYFGALVKYPVWSIKFHAYKLTGFVSLRIEGKRSDVYWRGGRSARTRKDMRRTLTTLAALVCGFTLTAEAPLIDAWNGTWKYNAERSERPGPTADTLVIAYGSDNVMTIIVLPFGQTCRGKLDGSYTPATSGYGLRVKHPKLATCAQKIVAPGVLELSQMYDGKLVSTDIFTMAADGKSFVDVATPGPGTKGKPVKVLYERQ